MMAAAASAGRPPSSDDVGELVLPEAQDGVGCLLADTRGHDDDRDPLDRGGEYQRRGVAVEEMGVVDREHGRESLRRRACSSASAATSRSGAGDGSTVASTPASAPSGMVRVVSVAITRTTLWPSRLQLLDGRAPERRLADTRRTMHDDGSPVAHTAHDCVEFAVASDQRAHPRTGVIVCLGRSARMGRTIHLL